MSGRDEQAGALEDRWAAQHLDLPPEASAAQVRAHALKRLTEEDFSLTPETRWAMWVAVKSSSLATHRPAAEADWSQQQFLKGEVEQFAAEFFSLSCDARKRRWRELSLATEQSPHLARRV